MQDRDLTGEWGGLDGRMAGHGAHMKGVLPLFDVGETGDKTQVHQGGGPRKTQLHQWDKALAAGQDLGIITQFRKEAESSLKCLRAVIAERMCGQCSRSFLMRRGLQTSVCLA